MKHVQVAELVSTGLQTIITMGGRDEAMKNRDAEEDLPAEKVESNVRFPFPFSIILFLMRMLVVDCGSEEAEEEECEYDHQAGCGRLKGDGDRGGKEEAYEKEG